MTSLRFAISLLLGIIGLFLMWDIPHPKRRSNRRETWPRLSVIIPARNEAVRIPPLLESLAKQSVAPHEIIVVDDNSSDGTGEVARQLGAQVLRGQPLPAGWNGKTWACWQGAQHSTGELLMFVDADTWLEPEGLANLMEEYERQKGLMTVQPYHVTYKAYEQLSAFFNIVLMAAVNAFTPLRRWLKPGGGFGACALCSREDYFRLGGHTTVKAEVLEDIALAKRFKRQGLPVSCYGGRGTISFRMYPEGLGQLVEGWSKGFGSGAFSVQIPFLILTVAWVTGCFRVSIGLMRMLAMPAVPDIGLAVLLYAFYASQVSWILARIGRFQWWTSVFFPIPLFFFALLMLRSLILIHVLRRVTWRGRTITTSQRENLQ